MDLIRMFVHKSNLNKEHGLYINKSMKARKFDK